MSEELTQLSRIAQSAWMETDVQQDEISLDFIIFMTDSLKTYAKDGLNVMQWC